MADEIESDASANHAPEWLGNGGGTLTRVSTSATGGEADGQSFSPTFSPDGTKVAFHSYATNLMPGDTNGATDVYVKDLTTGEVIRVSTNAAGVQTNADSNRPVFVADGTKVIFESYASNLVPGDTNAASDIFVKDLATGEITRLSTGAAGAQGDNASFSPVLSPDGSKLAFYSWSSNFVADDTNFYPDVFVKDLATGAIVRVSTDTSGAQGDGESYGPAFSPDGTKVLFYSYAPSLEPGEPNAWNGISDLFVKDLATGELTLISTNAQGEMGNAPSYSPMFTADGTKVVFMSDASNLAPGDTNGHADIMVKDLETGEVTAVSASAAGEIGNDQSFDPQVSPDGTKVLFASYASNLVPDDTNGTADIFVKDLETGEITRLSLDSAGGQGNGAAYNPAFSADGTKVIFSSDASNMVSGDTNGIGDVFIVDLTTPSVASATLVDDAAKASLSAAGKLYFVDDDASDVHAVSVAPQGGALGTLTATVVPVAGGPDHVDWSYTVDTDRIEALDAGESRTDTFILTLDDGNGGTVSQDVAVTLVGIEDAPILTVPSTVSFAEGGSGAVLTAAASDPEGDAVAFSLSGTDSARFDIAADGTLTFKSVPDFEAPADAGGDNVYDLVVVASDGTLSARRAVAVTVTDRLENHAPEWASEGRGDIVRVSTDAAGGQVTGGSVTPAFSADGTKLAFESSAPDLVPGDTNAVTDIFVKDLATGEITRVSTTSSGEQLFGGRRATPVFSPDGTKVAFASSSGATLNGSSIVQILVKDLTTGELTPVSTTAAGTTGNGTSGGPVFSPDGENVVFWSTASNLVAGDTNRTTDLFVKNLATGEITRVSTNAAGEQWNRQGNDVSFSPDGTRLLFSSDASNLVPGDTNGTDVFVKDLTTGEVTRVSTTGTGAQANGHSNDPVFSPDGTKVAFWSDASNLVAGDTNRTTDIFVKDLTTGEVVRVSADAAGVQGDGRSINPVFSPDGSKVAFESVATNLVAGDANGTADVFVKDLTTGAITRASTSATGAEGDRVSMDAVFSPDGTKVAFSSGAAGLVPGDTNGRTDIFVKTLPEVSIASATLTEDPAQDALFASGQLYFTDEDTADAHIAAVAPKAGAIGTLTAIVVPDAAGAGHVAWSYVVDSDLISDLGGDRSHVDTFTLTLDDGHGGRITQNVAVTLDRLNAAPVASADSYTTQENAPLTVAAASGVLANDADPDGDALTAALVTGPEHGTLALNTDGSFSYLPEDGYSGTDGFIYTAADGALSSGVTRVDVTVAPADLNPIDGTPLADLIIGTAAGDHIRAGRGADIVFAGDGDDRLEGGGGMDLLQGGDGRDTFVFQPGDGQDVVLDFEAGPGPSDVIELDAGIFADYEALTRSGAVSNGLLGAQITYDDGSRLTLLGVNAQSLAADDFRFA